jgi:hypothetical protein
MVLYKAEGEITNTQATQVVKAGKPSRFAPAPLASLFFAVSGQWGNVSKNSGKRLPDYFSGAAFHMYSCATVITI